MAIPIAGALPATARKGAYAVFGLLALFSVAIHVVFDSIGRSTPLWLTMASIGITLLATAIAVRADVDADDDDYEEQSRLARRDRGDVAVHASVEPKFPL